MIFEVVVGPTRNSLLNRWNKEAAYQQTPTEHEALLNKYVRPGMNDAQLAIARKQGEVEEKKEPKYWMDTKPRRTLTPSSSFIQSVNIVPSLGIARITLGNRTYTYPMTSQQVGDMITSNSIGGYYNNFIKLK